MRDGRLVVGSLAIAWVLLGASAHARGQRIRPSYRLSVVGCAQPTLEAALSLEMGDALAGDGARAIRVECNGESTHVVAEDPLLAIRIERDVDSQTVEPHLRERVIALVVTQLVRSLEALEAAPATPSVASEVDVAAAEIADIREPAATTVARTTPDVAEPAVAEPAVAEPAVRSGVELNLAAGLRMHPIDATTALGSFAIDLRYEWIAFGLEGGGAAVSSRLASTELGLLVASVGVVPLRLTEGLLDAGAGVFVEGGAAFGRTVSSLAGYQGGVATALVLGAFVRGWMSIAIDRRVSLRIGVDVGWDYGLRVVLLDDPVASIDSLLVAVRLGSSFWL